MGIRLKTSSFAALENVDDNVDISEGIKKNTKIADRESIGYETKQLKLCFDEGY